MCVGVVATSSEFVEGPRGNAHETGWLFGKLCCTVGVVCSKSEHALVAYCGGHPVISNQILNLGCVPRAGGLGMFVKETPSTSKLAAVEFARKPQAAHSHSQFVLDNIACMRNAMRWAQNTATLISPAS